MIECLGLCDYVDDICMGCGRDLNQLFDAPDKDSTALPESNVPSNANAEVLTDRVADPS